MLFRTQETPSTTTLVSMNVHETSIQHFIDLYEVSWAFMEI